MRIREYQLAELERARELQDEMARLHIPSPVLSWNYEIKSASGEVVEKGIGKSNSYTRNALNCMAHTVGLIARGVCGTSFGDGVVSFKSTAGTILSPDTSYNLFRTTNDSQIVYVGTDSTAESLDSYALPTSGLTAGTTGKATSWNSTTRKLVTLLTNTFANETATPIDIVEAGVSLQGYSSQIRLVIRDVFTAITVAAGETLNWTYTIEVSYPNP